jgi:hypothetical protein
MKNKLARFVIAAAVILAMASCVGPSPFTAPRDALTGIRMDIPRNPETGEKLWADFDPLEFPGDQWGQLTNHPMLTWQGRNDFFFGHTPDF